MDTLHFWSGMLTGLVACFILLRIKFKFDLAAVAQANLEKNKMFYRLAYSMHDPLQVISCTVDLARPKEGSPAIDLAQIVRTSKAVDSLEKDLKTIMTLASNTPGFKHEIFKEWPRPDFLPLEAVNPAHAAQ